jgi:sialic acid synthase SpsE
MVGPDHKASSTPEEFTTLVEAIRLAEASLGSPIKRLQKEEEQMRAVSRKSLFLAKDVEQGEALKKDHFVLKRPGSGIYEAELSKITNSVSTKKLVAGNMLKVGDYELV